MIRSICVAWILGISCLGMTSHYFQYLLSDYWWISAATALVICLLLWISHLHIRFGFFYSINKLILAISVFAVAFQYADDQLDLRLATEVKVRQNIDGIVYVKKLSEGRVDQWRQPVELLIPHQSEAIEIMLYPKQQYDAEGRVIGMTMDHFELGQYYQVTMDVKPLHGLSNRGSFDQEKWFLQQGIQGTATALFSERIFEADIKSRGFENHLIQQENYFKKWRLTVEKMRFNYRKAILEHNSSDQNRAVLLGLLTGDRSGISADTTQLYQYMGISHLLAISGPHVLILATMMTWLIMQVFHFLMRRGQMASLYLQVSKQILYLPIFVLLVSFYVAFTGFEIPALRTWIITMICAIYLYFRFPISPLSMLLIAAVVVTWWDCFSILSAAFWLSFIASAILLMIYQQVQQQREAALNIWQHLKDAIILLWQTQWRIFFALLPVVLWQFKAVSMISPMVNLIAIPFISMLIVPLDMIAAVLWFFIPSLGQLLWSMTAGILSIFNQFLWLLSPIAEWLYLPSLLTPLGLVSLVFAVLILCLPQGLIPKFWAIFFIFPLFFQHQNKSVLNISVLDVGQGQAVLVTTRRHQLLIDTGGGSFQAGSLSMGDRVIVPVLRHRGISKLDEVLLSHLDLDHAGGMAAIAQTMKINQLRSNDNDAQFTAHQGVPFIKCHDGQEWVWESVNFRILSPKINDSRHNKNESSCVVLITTTMFNQNFNILVMGDAGWETEFDVLQRYPELKVDVLILGHHGSKYSSAYDFLNSVSPTLAISSSGKDNRYGHPTVETKARLQDLGIEHLDTAQHGELSIELRHEKAMWTWQSHRASRKWLMNE